MFVKGLGTTFCLHSPQLPKIPAPGLQRSHFTHISMTSVFLIYFLTWDCIFGQVSRQNRPEAIPANPSLPILHSLIEEKVGNGTQMVDVPVGPGGWNKPHWHLQNVLLSLHRTLKYLLNVGGKMRCSPHTHTSFPVEDLPLRRAARTGFLQQKSLFEGGTRWGAFGLPVASGTGSLPSHHLQLQIKEEQQAEEDCLLSRPGEEAVIEARNL